MKQNWEKEFEDEFMTSIKFGGFPLQRLENFIFKLIQQAKQEKDKEYADFSERMNKALFEAEEQARQEERERIKEMLVNNVFIMCECENGECSDCDRLSSVIDKLNKLIGV